MKKFFGLTIILGLVIFSAIGIGDKLFAGVSFDGRGFAYYLAGSALPKDNRFISLRGGGFAQSDYAVRNYGTYGIDFDFKISDRDYFGIRYSGATLDFPDNTGTRGTYTINMYGIGIRRYLNCFPNLAGYLLIDLNYCSTANYPPKTFAGVSANAGAGIEYPFWQDFSLFSDVRAQLSSIKDANNEQMPLNTFNFNLGVRRGF